jgi:hypothetical protein
MAKLMPAKFFSEARAAQRLSSLEALFHWTRDLDTALKILADGYLRGRPGLSTSENPAFGTPGPVVFVLSPGAILRHGFTLWPYLYAPGYEQEAEWLVGASNAERDGNHIFTSKVALPLRGVVRMVGYSPGWTRHPDRVRALRAAARRLDLPVRMFDWERWWGSRGPVVARRNPRRAR